MAQASTFLPAFEGAQSGQHDDDSGEHSAADHDTIDSDRWQSARSTSTSLHVPNGFSASRQASASSHQLNGHVRAVADGSQSCSTSGGHKNGEQADTSSCASFMSTDTANVDHEDSDDGVWVAVGNNGKARRPDTRSASAVVAAASAGAKVAPARNGLHPQSVVQAGSQPQADASAAVQPPQRAPPQSACQPAHAEPPAAALPATPGAASAQPSAVCSPQASSSVTPAPGVRGGQSTPAAAAAAAQAAIEGANAASTPSVPARTPQSDHGRASSSSSPQAGHAVQPQSTLSQHCHDDTEVHMLRQQLQETQAEGEQRVQDLQAQLQTAQRTLAARDAEIAVLKQQLVAATAESMTPRAPKATPVRPAPQRVQHDDHVTQQQVPFISSCSRRSDAGDGATPRHSLQQPKPSPPPPPPPPAQPAAQQTRLETRGLPIVRPRANPQAASACAAMSSSPQGQPGNAQVVLNGANSMLSPHHASMQKAAMRSGQSQPGTPHGSMGAHATMHGQPPPQHAPQRHTSAAPNPVLSHSSAWAGGAPSASGSGNGPGAKGVAEGTSASQGRDAQQHTNMAAAGLSELVHRQQQDAADQAVQQVCIAHKQDPEWSPAGECLIGIRLQRLCLRPARRFVQ